jgi:heme exporter protein D
MIEGGWPYIWGAYGVALVALVVLTVAVLVRLAHWAGRADKERRS